MRIRLRGPFGVSTLSIDENATVADLRAQIQDKTSLHKYDIKYGYPPKPLYLDQDSTRLSSLDAKLNGEQLIITSQDGVTSETLSKSDASQPTPSAPLKPGALSQPREPFSFASLPITNHQSVLKQPAAQSQDLISLKPKALKGDVPEIPLPDRGATLGIFT